MLTSHKKKHEFVSPRQSAYYGFNSAQSTQRFRIEKLFEEGGGEGKKKNTQRKYAKNHEFAENSF